MKEEIRRAAIAAAWKQSSGSYPANLYSYETGRFANMSGGYDYEMGAHYSESYHYGTNSHFSVQLNGTEFTGYDYGSSSHFSGKLNGRNITLFDNGKYRDYSV